jgi:hypothetical protein
VFAITDLGAPFVTLNLALTSTGRLYDVEWATNLLQTPNPWTPYGFAFPGTGSNLLIQVTNNAPFRAYRSKVRTP